MLSLEKIRENLMLSENAQTRSHALHTRATAPFRRIIDLSRKTNSIPRPPTWTIIEWERHLLSQVNYFLQVTMINQMNSVPLPQHEGVQWSVTCPQSGLPPASRGDDVLSTEVDVMRQLGAETEDHNIPKIVYNTVVIMANQYYSNALHGGQYCTILANIWWP